MIALATILQWLAVPLVKWAVTGFGVAAVLALWLWRHDVKVAQRAEAVVIERSAKAGAEAEAKADKAHEAAARPGAAARLLKNACRDCRQ